MERSSGVKILSRSNTTGSSGQRYNPQFPGRWIQSVFGKIGASLTRPSKQSSLPQHNGAIVNTAGPLSNNPQANQQILHMMACIHKGNLRKNLFQDDIGKVKSDRDLFVFMRKQYKQHRGRFKPIFSLKTIEGIFFVNVCRFHLFLRLSVQRARQLMEFQFRLRMGGNVEIRHHDPCCTSTNTDCSCIPPALKVEPPPQAEYRCIPGPPSTYPPVLSDFLMHLLNSPCELDKNETEILNLLPKRICGELQGRAGQAVEGWGIYYKEGWDRDMIVSIVFLMFLLVSLLFGVLWSIYKMDMQGAFGVSAYMGTAASILLAIIAMRVDK
jgi:hypothetical protein